MKVFNFNKTVTIYLCVNKDGYVGMHSLMPTKDEERGIWVSKMPYCNSLLYPQLSNMVEKSKMTWDHEPEPLVINI